MWDGAAGIRLARAVGLRATDRDGRDRADRPHDPADGRTMLDATLVASQPVAAWFLNAARRGITSLVDAPSRLPQRSGDFARPPPSASRWTSGEFGQPTLTTSISAGDSHPFPPRPQGPLAPIGGHRRLGHMRPPASEESGTFRAGPDLTLTVTGVFEGREAPVVLGKGLLKVGRVIAVSVQVARRRSPYASSL